MSIIIDRRLNDRNKNAVNRQRFLRRYSEQIRKSISDVIGRRPIKEMEQGTDVSIPIKDVSEPTFSHGVGGDREYVNAGNHEFNTGDKIPRPPRGGSGDGHGEGGAGGESSDTFNFALSREEFMNLFFDDLELPHLVKNTLGETKNFKWHRAGYTPTGVPANLSVTRSLRQAMGRRIALSAPLRRQLRTLQDAQAPQAELDSLQQRINRIPFVDEIDLRYRHRVKEPEPISQAVMFCLMDVSASMTQDKKDLAKRFYTLLYLFLTRKYETVEIVFIRHTDVAQEVDEETFFHDARSGGTVVLSALKMMKEVQQKRFPSARWNIYGAQVSDGDAFGADPRDSRLYLTQEILPVTRYYAYIEVPDFVHVSNPLGNEYREIHSDRFAMRRVTRRGEVYPVLRELFNKERAA